jgi:cyclophilin family peptidyl-prolyl cis-trans isomerase
MGYNLKKTGESFYGEKGRKLMSAKVLFSLLGTVSVLTVLTVSCGGSPPEPAPAPPPATTVRPAPRTYASPPPMTIDTTKKYTAIMETEKGNLVLELFAKDVPRTVNNFVFLANEGFYDGTTFHRVIPDFMAQGGDPTGTGAGGPGYKFDDEFTSHKHGAGALSMANAGPNTNGSQFFITYTPQPGLDGKHSVFGQLIEGMDVLKKLTPRDPSQNPQFEGDRIIRVVIKVE